MMAQEFKRKALPSVSEYFDGVTPADGFEDWVQTCFFLKHNKALSDKERLSLAILKPLMIAIVEGVNLQIRAGARLPDIYTALPRAAGFAIAAGFYSAVDEACPRSLIRRHVREGVRDGIESFFRAMDSAAERESGA